MKQNSNQTVVTAVAIVIALVAVVYAVYVKTTMSTAKETAAVEETTDQTAYTEGAQNPVVLNVNGHDITRAEVLDNFAKSGSTLPEGVNIEQIFPLLQEQYLVGYLLQDAARDAGINGATPEVARKMEDAREQALRAVYIEQVTKQGVTDADIQKAYDDVIANAPVVMERKASHILVKTEAEANDVIEQLKNGATFADLAKKYSGDSSASKGGDLGFFAAGEMVPEFSDAAFAMQVGSFSTAPVKSQFGYHVIFVEEERARAKPSFEDIKPQLEQQLRQAVVREKLDELRQKATVSTFDYNGNPIPVKEEQPTATAPVAGEPAAQAEGQSTVAPAPTDAPAQAETATEGAAAPAAEQPVAPAPAAQ